MVTSELKRNGNERTWDLIPEEQVSDELGDQIPKSTQKCIQRKERRLKIVSEVVEADGREIRPSV